MDAVASVSKIKAGRPTREQAEARLAELLDAALDHFLDKGFELATIEAIATSVNMTKRTVYARFPDKVALFRAAVRRAIEQLSPDADEIRAARADSLEQTLHNIAWMRVRQVMTPAGLKLQRIINTESYRFPDIFTTSFELGALPVVNYLAEILAEETRAGHLAVEDPHMAAGLFMSIVVSGPVRIIVSGNYLPDREIERRVSYAIRIFLDGTRKR